MVPSEAPLSGADSPLSEQDERQRDEVVKRMLATPPQPREKRAKKKGDSQT